MDVAPVHRGAIIGWMVGWMRWPSGGVRNRAPYAAHNLKLRSPMHCIALHSALQ